MCCCWSPLLPLAERLDVELAMLLSIGTNCTFSNRFVMSIGILDTSPSPRPDLHTPSPSLHASPNHPRHPLQVDDSHPSHSRGHVAGTQPLFSPTQLLKRSEFITLDAIESNHALFFRSGLSALNVLPAAIVKLQRQRSLVIHACQRRRHQMST